MGPFFFAHNTVRKGRPRWVAVQPDAIGTARTSHIPSPGFAVVCQILRSGSSILVARGLMYVNCPYAFTWCLTNMNNFHLKPLKLAVSVPTSTLLSTAVKISSMFASDYIPSMSTESTRCCRVQELIGSRLE